MMANLDEKITKAEARLKQLKKQKELRDLKRDLKQSKEQVEWTRGAIQNSVHRLENQAFQMNRNARPVKVVEIDAVRTAFQSILNGKNQN